MKREELMKRWNKASSTQKSKWVSEFIFDQPVKSVDWIGHFITHKETGYEYRMPIYVENISAAWEIAERYPIATVERVEIFEGNIEVKVTLWEGFDYREPIEATAKTVPEAICKAALLAVLEDINLPGEETE